MPATARPMPRPRPAGRVAPPRPTRPSRPPAHPASSAARAKPTLADRINLVLFLSALAIAAVVGIAVIWEFGAARNLSPGATLATGGDGSGRPGDRPTLLYRDMRDGRVMVMEIGADGTRIKGTVAKSKLGIAADMGGDVGAASRSNDVTSADRVNALGSAFRN